MPRSYSDALFLSIDNTLNYCALSQALLSSEVQIYCNRSLLQRLFRPNLHP